ncbi:MAG: LysR family transcriptional regulator, partial [Comamonas sp.]
MMNLLHWRLLVAVADAGTISRAAERVGITQSGASQAIAQLEAALGFQVFARERRHIGVTTLGEQVIAHARAMLERLDAIRVLADDSRGLNGGRIRLASFPSVISTLLPGLLRDFRRRHPGIELVALEGTDEEVEDWLAAGTVELGVVLNPAPGRAEAVLGRDAWVAVLPTSHPLGRRASARGVTLEELATQPFILATGSCALNGKSLMAQAGLHLPDVRVTVRDWASACVLVREGMGVALVPESTLPDEQRGLRVMPL